MKYIMIETTPQDDSEKRFIPVIFPRELTHLYVAQAIQAVLTHQNPGATSRVRSAGEVTLPIEPGAVSCDGGSETLAPEGSKVLASHKQDADIIRLVDYHHGLAESVDMTCLIVDREMAKVKLRKGKT